MRDVIYNKLSSKSKLMVFLIGDGGIILLSLLTALLLRFDFVIPSHFIVEFYYLIPITLIAKYASFAFFHLYKGMFRYTSLWDITNIVKANALASVMIILGFGFFHGFAGFPRSLFLIDFVMYQDLQYHSLSLLNLKVDELLVLHFPQVVQYIFE